jgi:hypothetical protein
MEADTQHNLSCSMAARIKPHPARYNSFLNQDNRSAWQSGEAIERTQKAPSMTARFSGHEWFLYSATALRERPAMPCARRTCC